MAERTQVPGNGTGKGSAVHGIARLRLVRANPFDGMEECPNDDCPQPLPFPSCVRSLPRKGSGCDAEEALKQVTLSLSRLRAELERDDGPDDSPRAA